MIWIAIVKSIAIGYAATSAWRIRFAPALALLVSMVATVLVPVLVANDDEGALASAIFAAPWALPLVSSLACGYAARRAFRELDETPAGTRREDALTSVAYGLLANALIDAALLVIVLLVMFLMSR